MVITSVALALTTATSENARQRQNTEKPLFRGSSVPVPVRIILQRACQDCHSANTVWPWYANIPPISWRVHRDVAKGRASLDLSRWNEYPENEQRGLRIAIEAAVQQRRMPPPEYVWMHRGARLSANDIEWIEQWARSSH